MPHKRPDSPFWWISYTDASGRRSRESSGTSDFKEAAAIEAKRRYEAHQQQTWGVEPTRTFDELLLPYLKETESKKSSWRDTYSALPLTEFFTGRALHDITPQDINDYKRHRRSQGLSDGTVIKELRLFSAAINYARKEWGWRIENVVSGRVPKKPQSKLRWLTREEFGLMRELAAKTRAKDYLVDFLDLAVNTGMRLGEMLDLEWSRVDFGQRLVYLEPDQNKGGRHRSVPLNDTAVQALRNQWGKHPRWVFVKVVKKYGSAEKLDSLKKSFNKVCNDAGISDVTRHTLRHTCAAWMVQAGVPLRTVADVLGHTDIRTTMIYAHLAPENAHAGVAALDQLQRDQNVTKASEKVPKQAISSQFVTRNKA